MLLNSTFLVLIFGPVKEFWPFSTTVETDRSYGLVEVVAEKNADKQTRKQDDKQANQTVIEGNNFPV